VTRWRRPGADEILLSYVLLATIGFIGNWLSRSAGSQHPLPSFLITAFLAWRVSRGGWFARRILIVASFASGAVAAVVVARRWDLTVMALVIIAAAQVALLVSPPVYGRIRRVRRPGGGLPAALADRRPDKRAGDRQGRTAQRLHAVGAGQHVGPVPSLALADGTGRPAGLVLWRGRADES
jgi:hypothetical protein